MPESPHFHANKIFFRQPEFRVQKYLFKQTDITRGMRTILVDWMAEIQESFELNHETFYLAVKIVDLYLSRKNTVIPKGKLQLIGTTAIFIACKFDVSDQQLLQERSLFSWALLAIKLRLNINSRLPRNMVLFEKIFIKFYQ